MARIVVAGAGVKGDQMGLADVDGVGIEYEVTGAGRPVVLLHGFPESGRLRRHQVPALAGAGFRVIVPDLRGYGRSGKPEAVEAYSLPLLAGDDERVEGAGHWLQLDAPEQVNALLLDFLPG
jgi:pimeloyl-ACP methyl ester carboxylesterase